MKGSAVARWYYSNDEVRRELGENPLDLLADAETVKTNAVRKVFRSGEYFIKLDRRGSGSFKGEFRSAQLCCRYGIPAVEHLAWGKTPEGFFLVTRAADGFVEMARVFKSRQKWQVYEAAADFLASILNSDLYHPDLHLGNVLIAPANNDIKLVDLHGIREKNFFDNFRFYMMQRCIMELRDHVSDSEMLELIKRCGIRRETAFFRKALLRESLLLRKIFPKRQRQVMNGYFKFTNLRSDGLLVDITASPDDLDAAEEIQLPEAEKVFLFHFFLMLAHIPHRRVLALDRVNSVIRLEREIPQECRSSASAEQLQNRLLYNRIKIRPEHFCDGGLYDITAACLLNL